MCTSPQDNLRKVVVPQIEFCQEQICAQNEAMHQQLELQQDFIATELGKESAHASEVMQDGCKQREHSYADGDVSADGCCILNIASG
jgi:hypothetical protein